MSYHFDQDAEDARKVAYIEGELARGDRHKDDVKLLRYSLDRLRTAGRIVGRSIGNVITGQSHVTPTPAPIRSAPRKDAATRIAEQMAEAGAAAVKEDS